MREYFLLPFSIVFFSTIIDQISKYFASTLPTLSINKGLFLGIGQSHFHNSMAVVVSVFFIFVLVAYIYLLRTLERHKKPLLIALSFLIGGVLGNVTDRVLLGFTRDFIPGINSTFNIADIFIVLSCLWIFIELLKKRSNLFRNNELRNRILINKKEQIRFGLYFVCAVLFMALLSGVFAYTFFIFRRPIEPDLLKEFLLLYITISFLSCCYAFVIGILLSHKSIGALYSFEKHITSLIKGDLEKSFKLRERDDFKHLEDTAKHLKELIKKGQI